MVHHGSSPSHRRQGKLLVVVGGGLVGGGRAVGGVVHDFHVGADFVGTSVVVSWQALRSC